jgi:SAM-dependent methyltransferase
MSSEQTPDQVRAGQAVYTPLILRGYDWWVLGVSNSWIWRCPTSRLVLLYDDNVGQHHCDVGVGTGYFLAKARWPADPSITLVDLNANSLTAAARRIYRHRPQTVTANVLEPLPPLPTAPFDSVGLNYLLHCLPGSIEHKARSVFGHLLPQLRPGGVVFGSTLLTGGVPRSRAARRLMSLYNRKGIFHNTDDTLDGLTTALRDTFSTHTVEVVGCAAVFTGTR